MSASPRILLIDSYDSFTHNLAALCRRAVPDCHVHIIKNDALSVRTLASILPCFSAVIVGPGPGSPDNPHDIGVVKHLWKLSQAIAVPVFGVCLGLQSLAIESGAKLQRLNVVKHGQISRIHHDGTGLFKGIGDIHAVRYHSLHVELSDRDDVEQLAWADDGAENGAVVMAVKHKVKPFWAVQYHPESVCTSGGGVEVLRNFWRLARNWHVFHDRKPEPWSRDVQSMVGPSWPQLPPPSVIQKDFAASNVLTAVLHLPQLSAADVCDLLGAQEESSPFTLLESAAQPGKYSIIGCIARDSPRVTYSIGDSHVRVRQGATISLRPLGQHDIWTWMGRFIRPWKAKKGVPEIPFWGGFIGYLGYELGVDSLSIPLRSRKGSASRQHPDVNLVFVERSIVMDSHNGDIFIQSLNPDDTHWLQEMTTHLLLASEEPHSPTPVGPIFLQPPIVTLPDETVYKSRIQLAKEHLFAGESYELCLTAHTHVTARPRNGPTCSSWDLYKLLQTRNPAPHSGYLRLHPTTLLSSSPERFLSFSRPPHSKCQLRPIKGTVRKAPGITREIAEELLAGSRKEVAENLMIVDLIRHDLHGVVGDDVDVKQFCRVEEYETVWQLVSVIEGGSSHASGETTALDAQGDLGWEVLKRSLPPGSMTGAPKKRSIEILQDLEDNDRSVYSGVFGYWCVGGAGDWSVVIRSCFKYDGRFEAQGSEVVDLVPPATEEWTIGAGGAITALSEVDAEWDEMVVKLQSVLRTFEAAAQ
ncbi:para-aminobenzoate synthase [Auriscalpium vulgare]|uniref:Para-aminobenzoate synthase n=1 Tax=Auriscalpium vulgare TaxID=40419 RepID=A0ACB8RMR8_9AGAM|nr:para-aminobenzoate synthase [Auriscalpium vulgare]